MRDQEIIGLYEAYASIYKNNNANEEFETWVNSLVEEGYDLSEYTWDDMYEMYVNLDENMTPADIERIAQQAAGKKKKQKKLSGFREESQMTPADIERIAQQAAGKKKKQKKLSGFKEESEYDVYDLILSHLLDEGYADTEEAAEAIMVNMSEDWKESIVEGDGAPMEKTDSTDNTTDHKAPGFRAPEPAKKPKFPTLTTPPPVK